MNKKKRRKVEVLVLSDIHLGTYGCHAKELLNYLKSVYPKTLVLNGDIIDIWQFNKRYWPKSHMKIIKQIINYSVAGTQTYYITGNHDEMLRKFEGLKIGNLKIVNQLTLELDTKKTWFFHGDVFDVIIQNSKWLAKLGAISYDSLIVLNAGINFLATRLGRQKLSLSKKIKDNVKTAVKYVGDFEITAAKAAIKKGYQTVLCGHIHQPQNRLVKTDGGTIHYLNSGDWIENLSALEYNNGEWAIYKYDPNEFIHQNPADEEDEMLIVNKNHKEILKSMLQSFE